MINNLLSFISNENIYLIANWGVITFAFFNFFLTVKLQTFTNQL